MSLSPHMCVCVRNVCVCCGGCETKQFIKMRVQNIFMINDCKRAREATAETERDQRHKRAAANHTRTCHPPPPTHTPQHTHTRTGNHAHTHEDECLPEILASTLTLTPFPAAATET